MGRCLCPQSPATRAEQGPPRESYDCKGEFQPLPRKLMRAAGPGQTKGPWSPEPSPQQRPPKELGRSQAHALPTPPAHPALAYSQGTFEAAGSSHLTSLVGCFFHQVTPSLFFFYSMQLFCTHFLLQHRAPWCNSTATLCFEATSCRCVPCNPTSHWQRTLHGHPPSSRPLGLHRPPSCPKQVALTAFTILCSTLFPQLATSRLFFNHQCTNRTTYSPRVSFLETSGQLTACLCACACEAGVVFSHFHHLLSIEFQLPSHSLAAPPHKLLFQLSTANPCLHYSVSSAHCNCCPDRQQRAGVCPPRGSHL